MNRFLEVCSVQLLNFLSAYSFATGHPENRIVIKKQIIIDKCNMKMKPFASTLNSASFESAERKFNNWTEHTSKNLFIQFK